MTMMTTIVKMATTNGDDKSRDGKDDVNHADGANGNYDNDHADNDDDYDSDCDNDEPDE